MKGINEVFSGKRKKEEKETYCLKREKRESGGNESGKAGKVYGWRMKKVKASGKEKRKRRKPTA